MLPILITVLIVGLVLVVVYFVGSQPSKAEKEKTRPARSHDRRARRPPGPPARSALPSGSRRRGCAACRLLLVIAAVVCLVIAVAQFRVAKAQKTPVIALVLDTSKSMDAEDVQPNRLVAAQNAAQAFVSQLPADFEVALVSFADKPTLLIAPTTDHAAVSAALGDLPRGEGTVIGDGLSSGLDQIEAQWSDSGSGPAAIVLLSDGRDTGSNVAPQEAADRAKALGIPVYTVVLGAQEGDPRRRRRAARTDRHDDGGQPIHRGDRRRAVRASTRRWPRSCPRSCRSATRPSCSCSSRSRWRWPLRSCCSC